MKKVIFATGNEGKMKEIREILGDLDIELLSLKDAGIHADIVEDGKTFEENHYFMNIIMTKWGYEGDNYTVSSNYLISWDNKLYYNNKINNDNIYQLKDSTELKYNNKSVTIKDGFTTKNDETNKVFAVGTDNYLYQVNKENTKLEKVSDKKIKDTKYTNDEKNNKRYYEITYEDNTTKKYDIINVSTLNKA